jgi:hypothetical protein
MSDNRGRTSKVQRIHNDTEAAVEEARLEEHRPWIDQLDVIVNLGLQATGQPPLPGHKKVKIVVEDAE